MRSKIILAVAALVLATVACSITSTATPPVSTDTPIPPAVTVTPTSPALPVVASPQIGQLTMLDVNNGWATSETAVLRTTDGGTTWHNATPVGLSGAPSSSYFLDANTAWVVVTGSDPTSGTLYRTIDGGTTWTSVPVPFSGGSIKFVDATHGWELIGLNAGMSHEAVAIFRTSDGGTTWSQVFINDPGAAGATDTLPLVGDKNGITALDANNGWVTGAQPSPDFIYIYTSADGGVTWAQQNVALPAAYSGAMTSASLPVFFGMQDAVLPVLLFANTNGADFYTSHDSGRTWTATTPVPQGGYLAVATATDFFVWDGSAPLYISHDAGASWSTITPNIIIKDNIVSFQFVNASTGWALTSDVNSHHSLYKTVDGGATWTALIP
jgi:photosystem II stability/assembly factor-like uncharacterized protein